MVVVAVVLSGCGVFDGTEVHEVSAACAAISRSGAEVAFFAPDATAFHEVNHLTGEAVETKRNILIESARIARGKDLNVTELDAVFFPGGFGAAKNLSTFAVSSDPTVNAEVVRVLEEFHAAKKPIGLCCIAPILAALVLGKKGVKPKITLGKSGSGWPYASTMEKASEMGAEVIEASVDEICVDETNLLVSTPAFMYDGAFHEIQDGVAKMIGALLKML